MEYIISFMETYGYTAMFIAMVLENADVPIPSEIVLGFAGYLIAQGIFDMHTTMVVGILAGLVGSTVSFLVDFYLVFVPLSPSLQEWHAIPCGISSSGRYSVRFLGRFCSFT